MPPDLLIFPSALWPQITPGIAENSEKQVRLNIPNTKLQMANADVLVCGVWIGGCSI
jgi:hypothetical protein